MARLRQLIISHQAILLVGDLVLCEVLQGVHDERHARQVEASLRRFEIASMVSPTLAVWAAANYRLLRTRGVTVRKTIDMLIGTFCIEFSHVLLHSDRDFDVMGQHLGLSLMHA